MQAVITAVFAFLNTALIAGFMYNSWDIDFGLASLFDERPVAPMIMIAFGLPVAAFGYWLVGKYLKFVSAEHSAFPRFAFTEFDNTELDMLWQKLSMLLICLLPLVGFGWAWFEFATHGQAWKNDGSFAEVSLWRPVPFELVYTDRWNDYKFGDIAAARTPGNGMTGASFLPFWHSVVWMGGMSLLVVWQSASCLLAFLRRRPDSQS